MSLESGAGQVGQFFMSAIISKIKTYVNYINECETNLVELLKGLEKLRGIKDTIDEKVLSEKKNLQIVTPKAEVWLKLVRELVIDESMKMLMNADMRVAKIMLRLMKNDLKKLVKDDGKMRGLVVKVMKDVAKRNRKAGSSEVPDMNNNDKEVTEVLEKVMEETINEFKQLMQSDEEMAIAAMHLLENYKEKLEELTEKDPEVAEIIANARKMSDEEEIPSDNHDDENGTKDNVAANVDTLRNKVTNLLKPVGDLILNEEVLKTLPENVRLGVEAMSAVIGNRRGLKAELVDSYTINNHRNCCCCVISYNYFSDRYYMSVAAEVMLVTVKEIIGNEPRSEDVTRPERRGEMKAIPTNFAELKSRNELFGKIITALASKDVNALGVFGMGGSGKTTLATEVANSKAKGIFDTAVIVEISESPNIESIQNQIGDGLELDLNNVHGIREKAIRLHNRLMPNESEGTKDEKKILIVLDNIWKKIDLDQIGIPRKYCKLLLTSRTKDVCKEMDVHDILEVGLLSKDEAKDLFKFQVKKVLTMEYKSVVDRLLKKCRGLPISIVATATSLKGKELSFWRQFAEESEKPISCQISGVHHETFSILRTSYEVMASEMKKKFFLLACLSPVGTSISIDNLMRYGIGLDLFQHVNKLSEAIDLARTWAEELVSSSMFLKGDSEEDVKIHDVVRESTMSFAATSDVNSDGHVFLVDVIPRWICEESFSKYTGISLMAQPNFGRLSGVKADLLQILLLRGTSNWTSVLESNFFQGMTNLKVLELLSMNFEKGLPDSLGKLKVLKTLHLVDCNLGDIKLIGELDSLLVLSLHGSLLKLLPDEIGKLHKLRLLDMRKCECEQARIPANVIAGLSLLEGLYLDDKNFTEWGVKESTSNNDTAEGSNGANINDLTKLDFLNVLEINMQEPVSVPNCDQFVRNLDKFQIVVGERRYFYRKPSQRALTFSKFDLSRELKKDNCLRELLKKVDLLAFFSATVNNIVPELDEEGFRDLSRLDLYDIDSISKICEGKAPTELFYNLRHLEVSMLEKLEVLLPVNPLPQKLTTLRILDCNNLTYIFDEDDRVIKKSDIMQLPCLKTLIFREVGNLISMVKQTSSDDSRHPSFFNSKIEFTSLEVLSLENNKGIVKLWDKESDLHSFQNLKVLEIRGCEEMECIGPSIIFLSILQLECLYIRICKKMQQVITEENERREESAKEVVTFPNLKRLEIEDSENFECFYGGSYKISFPCLEELTLSSVKRMTKFVGSASSRSFFPKTLTFTSLAKLSLNNNQSIVQEPNLQSFQNLKVLEISGCEEMESIGPPSIFRSLVQLETLTIQECKKMQHVISNVSGMQEVHKEIITIRKLKSIFIANSENFECFYAGSYKMAFPCLEKLYLSYLESMITFAGGISSSSFFPKTIESPCLKDVQLSYLSDEMRVLSNPPNLFELYVGRVKLPSVVFQSLSSLTVENVIGEAKFLLSSSENEGCVGTYSQLPKLEVLTIVGCPNTVQQFVKDDGSAAMLKFCGQLRVLELSSALNMEVTSLHPFNSLRELIIRDLTWEYLFSADGGFELLQSLEELDIGECPNLKVIVQGGDKYETVVFRQLKTLNLENLEGLTKLCSISDIPLHFPSLETVNIMSCNQLESLYCGESNQYVELPALVKVGIKYCDAMKSFSTRTLKAPNLTEILIFTCPQMVSFLLENSNCRVDLEMPSLQKVEIYRSPNMKSFSLAVLRAPKVHFAVVDNSVFCKFEDFNDFLQCVNSSDQTAADCN